MLLITMVFLVFRNFLITLVLHCNDFPRVRMSVRVHTLRRSINRLRVPRWVLWLAQLLLKLFSDALEVSQDLFVWLLHALRLLQVIPISFALLEGQGNSLYCVLVIPVVQVWHLIVPSIDRRLLIVWYKLSQTGDTLRQGLRLFKVGLTRRVLR